MKKILFIWFAAIFFILPMTGCTVEKTFPLHPSLQNSQLPPLIPLSKLFADEKRNFGYRISSDGRKLAWIAVEGRRQTIHFKTIGQDDEQVYDTRFFKAIYYFYWAEDNRHLLLPAGWALLSVDTHRPRQKYQILTQHYWDHPEDEYLMKIKTIVHRIIEGDPENIIIEHNARDLEIFDLYRLNIRTQKQTLLAENPGDVSRWITDRNGELRARVRDMHLEKYNKDDKSWTLITKLGDEDDSTSVLGLTPDDKGWWLLSDIGRDRKSLTRLDMETGDQTLVFEDPEYDLMHVGVSSITKKPIRAVTYPDYQKIHILDKSFEDIFDFTSEHERFSLSILSTDNLERKVTIELYTDKSEEYYLVDRDKKTKTLLGRNPIADYAGSLSDVRPVVIKSRDDKKLHGYLTIPRGTSGRNLPMVLLVHGGPWSRDYWLYDREVQFLANRGYAVLQINFRGSTGYGKSFMQAAAREFAGKMHDDLLDGVNWAIEQGIADPKKIAIAGGSYGGYAALVGVTFTPDVFACGVDMFGMSNLVTLLEQAPEYWKFGKSKWHKYIGNPAKSEDRAEMEAKSPIFKVDQVKVPVLISYGFEDERVTEDQSRYMVDALKEADKEVRVVGFGGAGHGFGLSGHLLALYREMELFLGEHLGGRVDQFDRNTRKY